MPSIADINLIQNQGTSDYSKNTQRKMSRRLSDEMFQFLVDVMNEGVIIVNNDGIIIYVNDKFCDMLGWSYVELAGNVAIDYIENSSRAGIRAKIMNCIALASSPKSLKDTSINVSWISSCDETIFSQVSPQIFTNHEEQTNLFFAVVTDITKSKKVKDSLIRSKLESHQLSKKLLITLEEEKKRIAGELHDGIGQSLSAIKFKIEELVGTSDDYSGIEELNVLIPLLQNATTEVRRISMDLRPSILDDLGLKATVSWLSREFSAIYPSIEIESCIEIKEDDLSYSLKTVLYRVIQESINNIVKHAKATHVVVRLEKKQHRLELSIVDDGVGLSSVDSSKSASVSIGLGLSSMKQRVEITSGIFTINSAPGKGTEILANWIWNPRRK